MNTNRFILQNIASRTVGTVMPPYWLFNKSINKVVDSEQFNALNVASDDELVDMIVTNASGMPMMMPLKIKSTTAPDSEGYWTLPVEPMVTITGKNILVKRYVSKGNVRGSVKERWTQDDYNIDIQGTLINMNNPHVYPTDDIKKLRGYCESGSLFVSSPLFEIFGITRMVVEDYEFPHTSGPGNQSYTLKGCSDDIEKLFLTEGILKVK